MTTPSERTRAQEETVLFLQELCDSRRTPGVPEPHRRHAEALLRHLASAAEMVNMQEITLRLFYAEQERDRYRAAETAVMRPLFVRVAVCMVVAFSAGMLIGMWLLRR